MLNCELKPLIMNQGIAGQVLTTHPPPASWVSGAGFADGSEMTQNPCEPCNHAIGLSKVPYSEPNVWVD